MAEAKSQLSGIGSQNCGQRGMASHRQRQMPSYARRAEQPFSHGVFVHADGSGEERQDVRLFWRSDVDSSVVIVDAEPIPPTHVDAFDIARFAAKADVITDTSGREVVLLADGGHNIQLEVRSGTVASGPARLRYDLAGFGHLDAKVRTLIRLNALRRLGRFPNSLFPPEPGAKKWAKALQAYDGMVAGASQREIATVIFSARLVEEEWGGRSDFLRLRVQRLLGYARNMVAGGYRKLLN
jgi:hypothetical protein